MCNSFSLRTMFPSYSGGRDEPLYESKQALASGDVFLGTKNSCLCPCVILHTHFSSAAFSNGRVLFHRHPHCEAAEGPGAATASLCQEGLWQGARQVEPHGRRSLRVRPRQCAEAHRVPQTGGMVSPNVCPERLEKIFQQALTFQPRGYLGSVSDRERACCFALHRLCSCVGVPRPVPWLQLHAGWTGLWPPLVLSSRTVTALLPHSLSCSFPPLIPVFSSLHKWYVGQGKV